MGEHINGLAGVTAWKPPTKASVTLEFMTFGSGGAAPAAAAAAALGTKPSAGAGGVVAAGGVAGTGHLQVRGSVPF